MEEVDEVGVPGSGVGAWLAPPQKKLVKKSFFKKALATGVSLKAETRGSVFAKAGLLSARELARLVDALSALAKEEEREDDEGVDETCERRSAHSATVEHQRQGTPSG